MKANLLLHQRIDYDDSAMVEMVLWRVPVPVVPLTVARQGSATKKDELICGYLYRTQSRF